MLIFLVLKIIKLTSFFCCYSTLRIVFYVLNQMENI